MGLVPESAKLMENGPEILPHVYLGTVSIIVHKCIVNIVYVLYILCDSVLM